MAKPQYGYQHQQQRAAWAPLVATGTIRCTGPQGCGQPIQPGEPWDLGHTTDHALGGRNSPKVPQHANRCNRAAGGRLAHQLARSNRAL